jgi:biotin transport system substrate-specific component
MNLKKMILISIFAALTAIGAFIIIPLPISPVPITLQMFFTFLAGGLLGKKSGFLSQLIYLLLGAIGLPIFAGGAGGIGALFGPTAGYLYGFLIAGFIAGWGKRNFWSKTISYSTGLIVIYILGLTGLIINTSMNINKALASGVIPFIPGDILKVLLASYLTTKIPLDIINKNKF